MVCCEPPPSEEPEDNDKRVATSTKLAYSLLKFPIAGLDGTLRIGARLDMWINTIGLRIPNQVMIVSIVRTLDFVLGFIIAKTSDNTRSKWGRRKPFIAVGFPLALVCFVMFCSAAYVGFQEPEKIRIRIDSPFVNGTGIVGETPCMHLYELPDTNDTHCPELMMCISDAVAGGQLDPATGPNTLPELPSVSQTQLAVYFAIFYFGYYFLLLG